MKKFRIISAVFAALTIGFIAIQCQHDDETVIPVKGPDPVKHGTEVITCTDCNTVPAASNVWYHDKSHSNVMWETQYKVFGSLLTGRFDYFIMDNLNFDEGVPTNITFQGWVRLNSVNTSEPGRDEGCLLATYKTTAAKIDEPENKGLLKSKPGTGRYSSSDNGFLVDADFTFLGITKTVTVKMYYAPKFDIGTVYAAGISSEFTINKIDFLPTDTNIGDVVLIRVNSLMRNKK